MKLMLDSGAYSAWRRGIEIDIDSYIEFIKKYGYLFECCVNLDVIGSGKKSYENWKYLRKKGVDTMPVYHIGTDEKWLVKYLKKTKYVGIGAIANLSSIQRMKGLSHIWKTYLIDPKTSMPMFKTHGMGLTAVDIMIKYPWYSVDSISPILQAGFGGIYVPRIQKGEFNFLKMDMYKVSDKSKAHRSNSMTSFLNAPKTVQKRYKEYFEESGYRLGSIVAEQASTPMFKSSEESKTKQENSLVTWYVDRVNWNLKMWSELQKSMPSWKREYGNGVSLYNGKKHLVVYVGSPNHFKYVAPTEGDLGQLFSFFDVNKQKHVDKILQIMKDNKIKPNKKL